LQEYFRKVWIAFGRTTSAGVTADPEVTDTYRQDAEKAKTTCIRFMETGNPGVKDIIDWPAWNSPGYKYVDTGYPFQVKSGYSLAGQ
jgi:hypothetical protein